MQDKLSKRESEKVIEEFFKGVKSKSPSEIKRIKKLAMRYNIKLKSKKRVFCRKCYSPNLKIISTKNKILKKKCLDCGEVKRVKL